MKALVQWVERAAVRVDGRTVGEIGTGLLVLVGVTHSDTGSDAAALARKVHGLRILRDERSVADVPEAGVLVVSQFTLFADTRKAVGRRGAQLLPPGSPSRWSMRSPLSCAGSA